MTTADRAAAPSASGLDMPRQGTDGWHQCWYAVALSAEFAPGQLVAKPFRHAGTSRRPTRATS